MNLFTVNQVNQVYVAKDVKTGSSALSSLGDIKLRTAKDGSFYFEHYGKGGITRSDVIDPKTVTYVNAAAASTMTKTLKSAVIKVNSAALSSSKISPVGEDFILRLAFSNYVGISPEDTQYWKYGVVHSVANMSTDTFYLKLAKSIAINMSRESVDFIKVYVTTDTDDSSDAVEVTATSNISDSSTYSGSYEGIIVAITTSDWIKGLKQQKPMDFEVQAVPVSVLNTNGTYDDLVWADVVYNNGIKYEGGSDTPEKSIESTSGNIPWASTYENGKLAADYEYFFHGERGDQYRYMGWPDYVPTDYLVDPAKTYDFVTVHFAYRGPNEDVQRSGKDITILVERTGNEANMSTLATDTTTLLNAINAIVSPNYAIVSGSTTNGHKAAFDSSGHLVDAGS